MKHLWILCLTALLLSCAKEEKEEPVQRKGPGWRTVRLKAECTNCRVAWNVDTISTQQWAWFSGGVDTSFSVHSGREVGMGIDNFPAGGTRGTIYVDGEVLETQYEAQQGGFGGAFIGVGGIVP